MNNNKPSETDLPSAAKLIKSTFVAISLAAAILVTAVLPAEYGIDPTGFGKILGLTKMGEIKVSLAQEAAADTVKPKGEKTAAKVMQPKIEKVAEASKELAAAKAPNIKTESITVSLEPDQGREVKVKMQKGGKVSYTWKTSNGRANFDIHGDSAKHMIKYHNYSKGSLASSTGELEAEFDGKHGWFWRNRTGKPMTITLEVKGEFTEMTQEV